MPKEQIFEQGIFMMKGPARGIWDGIVILCMLYTFASYSSALWRVCGTGKWSHYPARLVCAPARYADVCSKNEQTMGRDLDEVISRSLIKLPTHAVRVRQPPGVIAVIVHIDKVCALHVVCLAIASLDCLHNAIPISQHCNNNKPL